MAPNPKVADAIARIEASTDEKAPLYEALLGDIKTLSTPPSAIDDLAAIVDSFLGQNLTVVTTRALLSTFVAMLSEADKEDLWIPVGEHTLSRLAASQQPNSLFADAAVDLGELVATAYEKRDEFRAAAQTLAAMPLDDRLANRRGGGRRGGGDSDRARARVWIRILRNYLEAGDDSLVAAEMYLYKLKGVMHTVVADGGQDKKKDKDKDKNKDDGDDGDGRELALHFGLAEARIQDARRDFLSAAQRYYEISLAAAVAEEERLHTLAQAIKCAVLAPAGPRRRRTLGRLYRDDRSPQLVTEFAMLEKMLLDRLLSPDEVAAFARALAPHQLATTADGNTVLDRAVVDHNLLAASRIYRNIRFDALANLLGLEADRAEQTTARMIEQGRLVGRIDQLVDGTGIVWFDGGSEDVVRTMGAGTGAGAAASTVPAGQSGGGGAGGGGDGGSIIDVNSAYAKGLIGRETRIWDANVESLAQQVEQVTVSLQNEFPDFVKAHSVV